MLRYVGIIGRYNIMMIMSSNKERKKMTEEELKETRDSFSFLGSSSRFNEPIYFPKHNE